MQNSSSSSPFKYVFWGVLVLCAIGLMGHLGWYMFGGFRPWLHWFGINAGNANLHRYMMMPRALTMMMPTLTIGFLWLVIVAPLVYKDAKKRGMDPWMWATIATFVPFLIGAVIYLVARTNGRTVCESCGRPIRSEFKACPYCAHTREHVCPQCSRPIAPDWKICPFCERNLRLNDNAVPR